jgi:hypothetical protein
MRYGGAWNTEAFVLMTQMNQARVVEKVMNEKNAAGYKIIGQGRKNNWRILASGFSLDQGLISWRNVFLDGEVELPLGDSLSLEDITFPDSGSKLVGGVSCPTSRFPLQEFEPSKPVTYFR